MARRPSPSAGAVAPPIPTDEILAKERRVLDLARSGLTLAAIAQEVGYADRGGAHKALKRALARTLQPAATELRQLEVERLDRMLLGVWAEAITGNNKAILSALRISKARRELLGLDFAHGLAERSLALDEQRAELLVGQIGALLAELGLEQDERARAAVGNMLGRLHVQQLALDGGSPDDEVVDVEVLDEAAPTPRRAARSTRTAKKAAPAKRAPAKKTAAPTRRTKDTR